MILPSKIKFGDQSLKEEFIRLESGRGEDRRLLIYLKQALKNIEEDAYCGILIPKRLIPQSYIKKFRIDNLRKYNLPKGWRLLYSVEKEEITIIALILEWMDHKDYERRFNY